MEYELTDERKAYLDARGKVILTACPGSGKTTSIVKKLGILESECRSQYGQFRGFACLSFTNKACNEIQEKFLSMNGHSVSYPNIVSTIDSFLTENIVLPYWYMFKHLDSRPQIINEDEIINRLFIRKDGNTDIQVCGFTGEKAKLLHSFEPSRINVGYNCFYFNNKLTKHEDYAKSVILHRMKKAVINSQDAVYIADAILNSHKDIAASLAQRFPYIIVDEAQDTSVLQTIFFKLLEINGLENIEYVGDIYQSIYEWRQASPENFSNIMKDESWKVLHLTQNRRSVQHIIDLYSKLRAVGDPPIISHNVENKNIPIVVYKYDNTNIKEIIRHFTVQCDNNGLNNYHVLTRGNAFIHKYLNRNADVDYWKERIPYLLIKALQYKEGGNFHRAIQILLNVWAELTIEVNKFREKNIFVREGEKDVGKTSKMMDLLYSLPSLDETFDNWTNSAQLVLKEKLELNFDVNFNPYKRKKNFNINRVRHEPIAKYYREDSGEDVPFAIETIHSSKGASYGGVLLFLSGDSKGNKISINDFKNTQPLKEKQRLIYVACSRAEQFLAIAIPDTIPDMKIKRILGITDDQILRIGIQRALF